MKKIFDFLYYCLHRMFKALKRKDENDEHSACSFYSLLLSTNTMLLFSPLKFIIPTGSLDLPLLKYSLNVFLVLIFVAWYFFCRWYFLKTDYYLKVISRFDSISYNARGVIVIGILYSILTPLIFIIALTFISKINWHI